MVSFTELVELIKKNPTRTESLPSWTVQEPVRIWRSSLPKIESVALPVAKVVPVPKVIPVSKAVELLNIYPMGRPLDILSIGIEDPMYSTAPVLTARRIEKEEAIRLEAVIPSLYSSDGGRSRGWTKKLLETHLRTRAAVGGDIYALKHAKLGFDWAALFTCKEMSALFDFFCLAKGIHCVVWKDSLHFGFWPAADQAILTKNPTLINIIVQGDEARFCKGWSTPTQLFEWVDRTPGAGWTPALSCLSILASKTVEELKKDAVAIGIETIGKKSEQIVQIAAARRRRSICAISPHT